MFQFVKQRRSAPLMKRVHKTDVKTPADTQVVARTRLVSRKTIGQRVSAYPAMSRQIKPWPNLTADVSVSIQIKYSSIQTNDKLTKTPQRPLTAVRYKGIEHNQTLMIITTRKPLNPNDYFMVLLLHNKLRFDYTFPYTFQMFN